MKKLINRPEDVVQEALAGLALAHPDLVRVDLAQQVVLRAGGARLGKVALVSGGGSGHEPLHAGFVGLGMLDAACAGQVFTSPVPDQVVAASRAVDGGAGVLHLVKNYTGDVMNFRLASEMLEDEGLELATVVIDDDVAVRDSLYTSGRRGVGATLLAEKIGGAAAERGDSLAQVAAICRRVNEQARSMGMALSSCTVPAAGYPTFNLGDDEMEIGIGIHGEPGRRRVPLAAADSVAAMLLDPIFDDLGLEVGDMVLCFVNGMGGTPLMELYVMFRAVTRLLEEAGVAIVRSLVGNYVTSLEMAGCSVTVLRLDEELMDLWDAPVHTPALRWGV